MKLLFIITLSASLAASAFAGNPPAVAPAAQDQPANATPKNAVCPVSGDKVGSVGKPVLVEYQGKKIALCCKECLKDFKKNPAKYSALADKNAADASSSSMQH
ncbi:MAG TPA: TRASH domain-containing protein [Chthoniobacterales bacterium]